MKVQVKKKKLFTECSSLKCILKKSTFSRDKINFAKENFDRKKIKRGPLKN